MIVVLNPRQDAQALHQLWQAAYSQEAELLGISDFPPLAVGPEELQSSRAAWYGVWQGGAHLLAACAIEQQEEFCQISAMLVTPDAQRQGLASRLLTHVCERYPEARLQVGTAGGNHAALALYRQAGFVPIAQQRVPLGQGQLDYVVLEKAAQTVSI